MVAIIVYVYICFTTCATETSKECRRNKTTIWYSHAISFWKIQKLAVNIFVLQKRLYSLFLC